MNLHLIGSDVAGLIGQILGRKVGGMWETLLVKECLGSVKIEAGGPQVPKLGHGIETKTKD